MREPLPGAAPRGPRANLDGATRYAFVLLYLAPLLAGTAMADWLSVPVFAGLFQLSGVARIGGSQPLVTRLVQSAAINLLLVVALFGLGRIAVWIEAVPMAPVDLWLTLGMASVAALLLRRIWALNFSLPPGQGSVAPAWPAPIAALAAEIDYMLDQYADRAELQGLDPTALEALVQRLSALGNQRAVLRALMARRNDGTVWLAALCFWLAHPLVAGIDLAGDQVAALFRAGMAAGDATLSTIAARLAMVWAERGGFGTEARAMRADVAARLARPLAPEAEARYLRPCLAALDRTLAEQR